MVIRPDIPVVKRDGSLVYAHCEAGTQPNNHSVKKRGFL
jgi:hypothetical protein